MLSVYCGKLKSAVLTGAGRFRRISLSMPRHLNPLAIERKGDHDPFKNLPDALGQPSILQGAQYSSHDFHWTSLSRARSHQGAEEHSILYSLVSLQPCSEIGVGETMYSSWRDGEKKDLGPA